MIYSSRTDDRLCVLFEQSISLEDERQFKELVAQHSDRVSFDVTIVDSKSLSVTLFECLYSLKSRLQLSVNEESLSFYLNTFGLNNRFKNPFAEAAHQLHHDLKVIVIGGGLDVDQEAANDLMELVKHLPFMDLSVFIVFHGVDAQRQTQLLALLQQQNPNYQVVVALAGMQVQPNTIYIAQDDYLLVVDGVIHLERSGVFAQAESLTRIVSPIDVCLHSLCYAYEPGELLVVLLGGQGEDGTRYTSELLERHHSVLLKVPKYSAKTQVSKNLPAGLFTQCLSLEGIIQYIHGVYKRRLDEDDTFHDFLDKLYSIYGYDFRDYDPNSLNRRIDFVMQQHGIESFEVFKQLVFLDHKFFEKLLRAFSVNVTTFFRNPAAFKTLREILPELATYPSINVWSAGCSRGDEPYSLAILFDELGLLHKTQIYATDFNATILAEAENGLYPLSEFAKFEQHYLASGGQKNLADWFLLKDGYCEVQPRLKQKISFFTHNLSTDSSINEFHLILCRNVVIYFDTYLKNKVYRTIDNSLVNNGFLLLGESEAFDNKYNYSRFDNAGAREIKLYNKGTLWK